MLESFNVTPKLLFDKINSIDAQVYEQPPYVGDAAEDNRKLMKLVKTNEENGNFVSALVRECKLRSTVRITESISYFPKGHHGKVLKIIRPGRFLVSFDRWDRTSGHLIDRSVKHEADAVNLEVYERSAESLREHKRFEAERRARNVEYYSFRPPPRPVWLKA